MLEGHTKHNPNCPHRSHRCKGRPHWLSFHTGEKQGCQFLGRSVIQNPGLRHKRAALPERSCIQHTSPAAVHAKGTQTHLTQNHFCTAAVPAALGIIAGGGAFFFCGGVQGADRRPLWALTCRIGLECSRRPVPLGPANELWGGSRKRAGREAHASAVPILVNVRSMVEESLSEQAVTPAVPVERSGMRRSGEWLD